MGCCAHKESTSNKFVIGQPQTKSSNADQIIKPKPNNNQPKYIPDEIDDDNIDNNNTETHINPLSYSSHIPNPLNQSHAHDTNHIFSESNPATDISSPISSDPPQPQSLHAVQSTDDFTNALDYALVKSWLENTVCLPQYYPVFITNGYESMQQIYTITDKAQLIKIGIVLKGHITKLMADIKRGRLDPELHGREIQNQNNINIYDNNNNMEMKSEYKHNNNNNIEIELECNGNNIENCQSVNRVLKYMKIYELWNVDQDAYGEIKWEIFSQQLIPYEITQLLNDYHHYQHKHNNAYNLHFVSQTLLESINNIKCYKTHQIENHKQAINDTNANLSTEDLLKLQILDQIHSQFMHNDTSSNGNKNITKQSKIKVTAMDDYDAPIFEHNTATKEQKNDNNNNNNNLVPIKLAPIITKQNNKSQQHKQHVRQCSKFFTQLISTQIVSKHPGISSSGHHSFASSIEFDSSDDDDDIDENSNNNILPSYGFGKRWYYWKHYKQINHKDYICAIYTNLKDELLKNTIYTIELFDWNAAYSKAIVYMKCLKVKKLFASGDLVHYYYSNSNEGETVKIEHIIALLFYCNYDNLQTKFSESFRIIATDHESNNMMLNLWTKVKNRNKQYANWARLLRELVELYGISMRQYPDIKLYHGINCELVFDSINCKFCAPTSMTSSRAIAESFSKGFGLILTLTMYDADLRFFDCSWLSDYPTEEEKLLIGGSNFIKLNSIILSRLGHNYKHYICAIGIIQNMFDARHNPEKGGEMVHKTMNAVTNLLQSKIHQFDEMNQYNDEEIMNDNNISDNDPHIFMTSTKSLPYVIANNDNDINGQGGGDVLGPIPHFKPKSLSQNKPKNYIFKNIVEIPKYVEQLFDYFCKNWDKTIRIDISKFNKISDYEIFKNLIIESGNDKMMSKYEISYPIKIDVICKIFENINCIEIVNGFIFTQYTFNYLFKLLTKNENNIFQNLNQIKIENSSQSDQAVQILVNSRSRDFAKNNWDIAYDFIDQTLETLNSIQQLKYVVLVKNDNDTLK